MKEVEIIFYRVKFGVYFPANFFGGIFVQNIAQIKSRTTENYAIINCSTFKKIPTIEKLAEKLKQDNYLTPFLVTLSKELVPDNLILYKKIIKIRAEEKFNKLCEVINEYLQANPLPESRKMDW